MTSYDLSRRYWDFAFENPELVSSGHAAIYFFAVEHCNRMGWKEKFGFPTQMAMDAIGIKKHATYIKYFNDLCDWGFFKLIQKSKNQYSANIISLESAMPKNGKALDKATAKHGVKHGNSNGQSTGQSNGSIIKPITINKQTINNSSISEKLFLKISGEEKDIDHITELFECDTGLKMSWHQKGFQDEKFSKGIEQWMILHDKKQYENFVEARKHFLFWIPNYQNNFKTQQNGTQSTNVGNKPGTSEARVAALKNWGIGGKVSNDS